MTIPHVRPWGDAADRLAPVYSALERGERTGAVELLGQPERFTPDELAALRCRLAEAYEVAGLFNEGLQLLLPYSDPATHAALSDDMVARVWLSLGSVYRWLGEIPRAITYANNGLRATASDALRGWANRLLGYLYWMMDEYAIARDYLVQALDLQLRAGDKREIATTYWNLSLVDNVEGHAEAAKEDCQRAFDLLKGTSAFTVKDHLLLGRLLNYMAIMSVERGDAHRAIADYEKAIEHWSFVEDTRWLALAYNNLGDVLLQVGEWKRAEAALLTAIQYIHRSAVKRSESDMLQTLADLQLYQGKVELAQATVERALRIAREIGPKSNEASCQLALGRIFRIQGKYPEALEAMTECLDVEERLGRRVDLPETWIELCELALDMGDRVGAVEHLEQAQKILVEQPNLHQSGLLARAEGRLRAFMGEYTEAVSALAQSISIFESISYVYQAGLSHLEMGRILGRASNTVRATSHLKRALRSFTELRAERDRILAEEALASSRNSGMLGAAFPAVFTLDALIIERLVAACSSHELLLRELATIIRDETGQPAVIFEVASDNDLRLVTARGCDRDYAYEAAREAVRYLAERVLPASGAKVKFLTDRREASQRSFLIYTTAETSSAIGHLDSLLKLVEQGLEVCTLRSLAAAPKKPPRPVSDAYVSVLGIVAESKAMRSVLDQIRRIRSSDVTVLITGESGVGKELVARAIHHESARRAKTFLPFNCAAVPSDLVEARIFGHRKGSFTGASSDRTGVVRAAEGGTLFLDEIGEVSLEIQPKLLRFLQDHEIQPLGEDRPVTVDVRVVAATNRNLEDFVAERRFREDLYYRLNVIRVNIPPLRERREDIRPLAERFLGEVCEREKRSAVLAPEAVERLTSFAWPGNVRQLRNEIERAVAMVEDDGVVLPDHFSPEIATSSARVDKRDVEVPDSILGALAQENLDAAVDAVERLFVSRALAQYGGNITHAARALGLSRQGLLLKKKRLGLE